MVCSKAEKNQGREWSWRKRNVVDTTAFQSFCKLVTMAWFLWWYSAGLQGGMPGALCPEASPISKVLKQLRNVTQRLTLFHFHFADNSNVETRPSLCRSNNRARMSLHPSFSWFSNNWPFFYPSRIVSKCKGFALVSIAYPVNKVHLWKIDHSICHASSHSQQLNSGNLAIATLWTNKDATYLIIAILVCNNLRENLITKQNSKDS